MAKRLRKVAEYTPGTVVMATVVCDDCGARFAIGHRSASQDANLASRQAVWLADKFVWDHIQEAEHRNAIALPASSEMK